MKLNIKLNRSEKEYLRKVELVWGLMPPHAQRKLLKGKDGLNQRESELCMMGIPFGNCADDILYAFYPEHRNDIRDVYIGKIGKDKYEFDLAGIIIRDFLEKKSKG